MTTAYTFTQHLEHGDLRKINGRRIARRIVLLTHSHFCRSTPIQSTSRDGTDPKNWGHRPEPETRSRAMSGARP